MPDELAPTEAQSVPTDPAPADTGQPTEQANEAQPQATEAESPSVSAEPDGGEPTAEPSGEARKSRAQERIEELLAERKAIAASEQYWREQAIAALQQQKGSAPEPQDDLGPKPTLESSGYDQDKFAEDLSSWLEKKVTREAVSAAQRQFETQNQESQAKQSEAQWQSRLAEEAAKHDDFAYVVNNPTLPIPKEVGDFLKSSDKGAEMLYYLGKNPSKAAKIASLGGMSQVRALVKLEDEISSPPAKAPVQPSRAPEPPNPVGTQDRGSSVPVNETPAEYARRRQREMSERRARAQ